MKTLSKKLTFDSKALAYLLQLLPSARLIGGCVRDMLLGISSYDIDLAVPIVPERVLEILALHKIKAIPTGIDFGTVTAVIDGEAFEITSLRKDIECDGRHVVVEYTEDFAEDAARRDFTINALSYSPSEGMIYDYYGGLDDLEAERVRFIGPPAERIHEDHLRILRFFRFTARYALEINQEGYKACIALRDKLSTLPRERINVEMDKLLVAKNASNVFAAMIEGKIDVMSGLNVKNIPATHELKLPSLYAIMLSDNSLEALRTRLPHLKFSRKRIHEILDLIRMYYSAYKSDSDSIQNIILELWIDGYDALQHLLFALHMHLISSYDAENLKAKLSKTLPTMPVSGNDLIGKFHGREIGKALLKLKKVWIASEFKATKEELLHVC